MPIRLFVIALLLMVCPVISGQEANLMTAEEILEDLYDDEDDADWDGELEDLADLLQSPINLNEATRNDLQRLSFLSESQIENLLSYVYVHGEMQSVQELQLVRGMDRQTIDRLLPFVKLSPASPKPILPSASELLRYGKHEVRTRVDLPFYTRQGYLNGNYLGTKQYHSLRYQYNYADALWVGLTAEKDAGEPFFALHDNCGYDFYSPYLLLRTPGRLRTLAIGNYRLSFGQGLVMNGELTLGKTYSITTAERRSGGIKKHSSTGEYSYFSGVAATIALTSDLSLTTFYSRRRMDGTVSDGEITSILTTGLHRTENEASKLNTFRMQTVGGNLSYEGKYLHVGATGFYYWMSLPYAPTQRTYSRYNLRGQHFYNVSIDYRWVSAHWTLAGEAAMGKSGYAVINRLSYRPNSALTALLLHRYYATDYWAYFARGFGDGTSTRNENGWYLALEARPTRKWLLFGAVDLVSFPWWKYRVSKASTCTDLMFRATYTPSSACQMQLSYRYKWKERDVTGTSGEYISPILQHKLRFRLSLSLGQFTLRTTADATHFRQQNVGSYTFDRRIGWLITQMAAWKADDFPVSGTVQFTYFDADDYDSRVYAWERGLLGSFYSPSYYGRGYRASVVCQGKVGRWLTLLLKFGQTVYLNRETISSDNDLINSNKKADLQLQLRLNL